MKPNEVEATKADYGKTKEGHLVQMTCGHRGIPCRGEEKRVSRLLRKSGFLPMLDNSPPNKKGPESPSNIKKASK